MPLQAEKKSSRADQFIAEVRAAMKAQDVSRADLASRLACSTTYVSRLLRGGRNLTMETMEKLVAALDLDFVMVVQSRSPADVEDAARGRAEKDTEAGADRGAVEADLMGDLEVRTIEDAQAILDTSGRELRDSIVQILLEAARREEPKGKPGPKAGSRADFRRHMLYLALQLESGTTDSRREAAKLTEKWADKNCSTHANWETLRSHFRKAERFYLAQARRILARQQREAPGKTPGDTGTEAPVARPARSASTASGTGGFHTGTLAATHLSALDWVNKELARIAGQYDLAADQLALLQSPGVLEAVGRVAEMQEIAGAMQLLRPDLTAVEAVNRQVNETVALWKSSSVEGAMSAASEIGRQVTEIAARLEPSILQAHEMAAMRPLANQDLMAAMSPDLTKRLKTASDELTEQVRALTRNPLSDLL